MQNAIKYRGARVLGYKIFYYLKSGFLLHSFTWITVMILLFWWIPQTAAPISGVKLTCSFLLMIWAITSQLDAHSRYQEYKRMKDLLYENGFRAILLIPFNKSHCQREAVLTAAEQFGCKKEFKACFRKMGVRWFHILPYAFTNNPFVLFNKDFLSVTFFQSYYRSKYFAW